MKEISRRRMLGALAAGGAMFGISGAGPHARAQGEDAAGQAAARPPNIIFMLADDLGYGDLGCYGQDRIKTPHLDRMAAEGMRFTNAYAGSTVCAPSRCVLMTGLHTGHCWVRGNKLVALRPEDVTVAEVLKRADYATCLAGKWGLGEPDTTGIPNRKGFDEFFGYLNQHHAHNYYPEYLWRNEEQVRLEGNVEVKPNITSHRAQYAPDLITNEALSFIERHRDRPFFLYYSTIIPHANNELGRESGDGMEIPSDAPYTEESWPQVEKNKAAMITHMDNDIGRILARIKELGLDENTMIFFSSDNGPHREGGVDPDFFNSSGPLRGIKRDLYDGGIRVPTIARWPGKIQAGAVCSLPWAFWDFLHTAADLAGVDAPPGLDGISIAPTLLGRDAAQPLHDHLYWEFHEGGFKQAVRMGRWKAVRHGPGAEVEIYDLEEDLGETRNLASAHPELVARAKALFKSERTDNPHWKV